MHIKSLRPNVTRDEAVRQFSGGVHGRLREFISGPLRSVADFYIPFRIYEVEIFNAGKKDRRILGLDAVTGSLDPYHFDHLPAGEAIIETDSRNCLEFSLPDAQAEASMVTKVQRLLFTKGFFRIRNLSISIQPSPRKIYVPYWVGFRGRGASASFAVIDAVRRQPEGARVRRILEDWLGRDTAACTTVGSPSIFRVPS
jgi:hypothetical protein